MSTKDYFDKDYYKILGVPKDAKPADIKKAFRKIARDNHPDAHPGNKRAEQRFKEASEAHDILSDADKRKEYDDTRRLMGAGFRYPGQGTGASSAQGGFGNLGDIFGGAGGADISDLLGGLFAGARGARPSASRASTSRPRRARPGVVLGARALLPNSPPSRSDRSGPAPLPLEKISEKPNPPPGVVRVPPGR